MNVGDKVSVVKLPEDLPENNDALVTLFKGCLGKELFKEGGGVIATNTSVVRPPAAPPPLTKSCRSRSITWIPRPA